MTVLAVVLESAALLAMTAALASLAIAGALLIARPGLRMLGPAARADTLLLLGLLPAVLALAAVMATLAPSVLAAAGFGADHCNSHGHHAHLCVVHAQSARPALMATGALFLALILFRLFVVLGRAFDDAVRVSQLAQLSRVSVHAGFEVFEVPCDEELCHCAGVSTRRIFISASLAQSLDHDELCCALAHEAAHLRRRDPLRRLVLSLAGCFVLPPAFALVLREYELAAEQACDAEAVQAGHDPTTVASALLNVARRMARRVSLDAPAFGEHGVELRVRALLESPAVRPRVPAVLLLGALMLTAAIPLWHAQWIHHAAETALDWIF